MEKDTSQQVNMDRNSHHGPVSAHASQMLISLAWPFRLNP